jgi:alkylated DNA repair dioxygenase AlkB
MAGGQPGLFGGGAPALPDGLEYCSGLIAPEEEAELAAHLAALPFRPFEFHGYVGNRRTLSFGWHYAFDGSGLAPTDPMPDWLIPLRGRAAGMARLTPEALEHVLLTEYAPGAGIGWHRDRPDFEDVVGISLMAPARLRFRRRLVERGKWERAALIAEPRSAYLLRGPVREEWQHSIAPMEALRYSITFRSLRRREDGGT